MFKDVEFTPSMNLIINSKFAPVISLLIILVTGSNGAVITPVACLESDGTVNIEINCKLAQGEININNESTNVNHCQICIDIPMWQSTPAFQQAIKTAYHNLGLVVFDSITQGWFNQEQYTNCTARTQNLFAIKTQPQLIILSTRLLL